jgi:hypothetical protein
MNTNLLIFLVILATPGLALANSYWDFEEGTAGWQIADMPVGGPYHTPLGYYPAQHSISGGAPGAFLIGIDPTSNTFTFQIPESALQEIGTFENGSLSYQYMCSHNNWTGAPYVIVDCGSAVLLSPVAIPNQTWQQYYIPFQFESFQIYGGGALTQEQFSLLMQSVEQIYIVAEYGAQVYETTSIDSVELIDGDLHCDIPDIDISYNHDLESPYISLSWTTVEGANEYQVMEFENAYEPLIGSFSTTATSIILPLIGTDKFYKVSAICE